MEEYNEEKRGRPRIEIDSEVVEKLATMGCTTPEVAAFCNCSEDTLERNFAGVLKKGRERGKMSLRRAQWKKAMDGNVTMLIWLGKQLLAQKEKVDQSFSSDVSLKLKAALEDMPNGKDLIEALAGR